MRCNDALNKYAVEKELTKWWMKGERKYKWWKKGGKENMR
jgi:hypothetical protein